MICQCSASNASCQCPSTVTPGSVCHHCREGFHMRHADSQLAVNAYPREDFPNAASRLSVVIVTQLDTQLDDDRPTRVARSWTKTEDLLLTSGHFDKHELAKRLGRSVSSISSRLRRLKQ